MAVLIGGGTAGTLGQSRIAHGILSGSAYVSDVTPMVIAQPRSALVITPQIFYQLASATGAYVYTGQAANLLKGSDLVGAKGAYTYTGIAAGLLRKPVLVAAVGAYGYTGNAANLLKGFDLISVAGSYILTGNDAAFSITHVLAAARGLYNYTGYDAVLSWSGETPAGGHTRRRRGR